MALKKNPKYDLKRKYKRTFEISVIIALTLVIAAFKFFPEFNSREHYESNPQELINVTDVELTRQDAAPPPPPKPPIPIETPSDDVLEDIEFDETALDENAVVSYDPPAPIEDKDEEVVPDFFIAVEELPEPIGGIAGIQAKIKYPDIARRANVYGSVHLMAYVDEEGKVVKVEVVKGIGAGCDEEAVKAVMETRFKPGKQRGKPVKVRMGIPIRFTLK
ncbi:MAG: energy transducer TonB [Bacteroidetes bacterium]|nr:energy transducer TonB [Bacteroidota bacterium]